MASRRLEAGKKSNPWWVLGTMGAFILTKLKFILSLLKLGSFGGTIISMAISIGAYAIIAPFKLSIGVVLLVFVHEMGHIIAAKRKGLPTSAPIFIPLLGAMINLKRHPRDAATEAYIAFGGPLLGTVGAIAVYLIGWNWHSSLLVVIAYIGFFINLINLLPIHPLDGGRISVAVSRWLWLIGLTVGLVVILYLHLYVMFFFWALFAYDLYKKYVHRSKKSKPNSTWATFEVPLEQLIREQGYIPNIGEYPDLAFETYSTLAGKQKVFMIWPEIGLKALVNLPEQGMIQKTHVAQLERVKKGAAPYLLVRCQVDYVPFVNDAYYQVTVKTRIKFGIAYGMLAILLIGMMYISAGNN